MKAEPKIIFTVIPQKGKKITISLKDGKWGESSYQLIDVGKFVFDETESSSFSSIEKGDEIILKATDKAKNSKTFYYWIEKVELHFENDPKTGNEIKNEVIITATSFPSILTRNFIEGTYKFSKGYGEVVKKIVKNHGVNTKNVKLAPKSGFIFFKRMTILEAIRRMASTEGWCFYFRGKEIYFEKCKPPHDSGVIITADEMIRGTITK